jgi:RHS repeat-associated protein
MRITRTYNSQDARDGLFGNGWSVSFDMALYQAIEGGVSEYILRTANGKRYLFVKLANGTVMTPPGRFEKVVPQVDGSAKLVFQDGSVMLFRKDGRLVSDTDNNGNTIAYIYDAGDQLVEMNDGNGRSFTFTYSGCGRISHITDHANRTWRYDYDANGNLIGVIDPLNGVRQYAYTPYKASGDGYTYQYLTKITDPTGVVVTQVVYSNGKVQSYTEGQNRYTYAYNTTSKQTTKTDLLGSRWIFNYNDQGIITRLTDPLNNQINFTYDVNGLLTQMTDQLGNPWSSTYDSLGRVLTTNNPLNETKAWEYTGTETRPTKLTTPSGRVYTFAYDGKGNITSVTDPAGAQAQYAWDAKGDLVTLTDALGNRETIAYNAIGLPITITDALNRTATFSYNNLGNLIQVTNPAGETTSSAFDALGRVTSVTNPLGHVTSFDYDAAGRLNGVTDANGGTTGYSYDSYGRLITKTSPDGRRQTYAYRTDNLLSSTTDRKSQTTSYTYDAAKRLTQENAAGLITSYIYSARNQLTSTTNPSGTVSAVYDGAGRLTQETNNGQTVHYTYNSEGERLSFTALGSTTSYAYDNRGLLNSITSPSGLFRFTHDLMGRTTSLTHPNNDVISYQYDAASQLTGISSVGIVNTSYGYERDAAGRITRWTGDGSDWFYQYAAGKLVRAEHGQDSFAYTYDPLGNIVDNDRTHDIANRLLADNDFTFTYDLNGNLTQKLHKTTGARMVYKWNARNQLTRVEQYQDAVSTTPIKTLTYTYDPFGRRVSKTEDEGQEWYVYDGFDLIGVLGSGGNWLANYTFGPGVDKPLGLKWSGGNYYFYADHLGSVQELATESYIASQYGYDPFGTTQVSVDTINHFKYTAREQDDEDLYYYRARYYDPTTYRFLNEDPIGFVGGDLNLYGYVGNNPINKTDPLGLFEWFNQFTYWDDFYRGARDFTRSYRDMRDANTIGADKYFHCMANCQAAREGMGGRDAAEIISEGRELTDQYIKGDPRSACDEDRAANRQGRNGNYNTPCSQVCGSLRPNGLDPRY